MGNVTICSLLLDKDADLDLQGALGYTALMYASRQGKVTICFMLLNKGARCDLKDDNGKTALDDAKDNCIELLQNACGVGDAAAILTTLKRKR